MGEANQEPLEQAFQQEKVMSRDCLRQVHRAKSA